jgi:hypothetical protein
MIEEKERVATDASVLANAYERWLRAYREHDASRQIVLHGSSFRSGMTSTLHLFPHHGERFNFEPVHRSVASAMLHDWFSVGGDLWAAYTAATIDGHGTASSAEELEPARSLRSS